MFSAIRKMWKRCRNWQWRDSFQTQISSCVLAATFGVVAASLFGLLLPEYFHDLDLAFPIIKAGANPGLYPKSDLIVSAGLQGPFHLYHLASFLYRRFQDFDALWYGLYLVSLWLTFCSFWY